MPSGMPQVACYECAFRRWLWAREFQHGLLVKKTRHDSLFSGVAEPRTKKCGTGPHCGALSEGVDDQGGTEAFISGQRCALPQAASGTGHYHFSRRRLSDLVSAVGEHLDAVPGGESASPGEAGDLSEYGGVGAGYVQAIRPHSAPLAAAPNSEKP